VVNKAVGDNIVAKNAQWSFGGDVAKHFDTHAEKSIPQYYEGHDLCAKVGDFFLSEGSTCYELGCSTGSLIKKMATHNKDREIKFIGVEKEENMAKLAKDRTKSIKNIEILHEDLFDVEYETASMFISYYCMQFISVSQRQQLFQTIFDKLEWGGALVLFEKVRAPDARFQDIATQLYSEFKLGNGYSADEILGKSRSLKGVLEPFSTQGNIDLMKRAGFIDVMSISKYVCFEGFLAIK